MFVSTYQMNRFAGNTHVAESGVAVFSNMSSEHEAEHEPNESKNTMLEGLYHMFKGIEDFFSQTFCLLRDR